MNFCLLFTLKINPASDYAEKKLCGGNASKNCQNYVGHFLDKGNVIAEPVRVLDRE
jgi:hypothetical protein